jgi:hypothetical protein
MSRHRISCIAGLMLAAAMPAGIARANLIFADNLNGNAAFSAPLKGVLTTAESDWSSVIGDNHAADGKDTFTITWQLSSTLGAGTLAVASDYTADAKGIPISATISINQDTLTSDGFFIDPTPADNSEYSQPDAKNFPTYYTANAKAVDPATGQLVSLETDLLTTVLHEVGHAIGIAAAYQDLAAKLGMAKPNGSRNFIFANGDFAVMTFDTEGTHVADNTMGQLGGNPYDQTHDLMNPTIDVGERKLISPMDIAILQEAYGYSAPVAPIPEPEAAGIAGLLVMGVACARPRRARIAEAISRGWGA